jgi:hypothetical protein
MTLHELFAQVAPHVNPREVKDVHTSLRKLAHALGAADPRQCQSADYLRPLDDLHQRLAQYFATLATPPSVHTVRNTRRNISLVFRRAQSLGLLQPLTALPPLSPQPSREDLQRASARSSPYRAHYQYQRQFYALPAAQWPPAIQAGWTAYTTRKRRTLRACTLQRHTEYLAQYLGFLHTIHRDPLTAWEDLFALERIEAFVSWHTQRAGVRMTTHAHNTVKLLRTITVTLKLTHAPALTEYCRELPQPAPLHDKRYHWLSRTTLEQIALDLLAEARRPLTRGMDRHHPGLVRAILFQQALILRLLVRIPLRVRNICELQRERNLAQDDAGCWWLDFAGEELKVGRRRGRPNHFRPPFPEDLVPHLEEFLATRRPLLRHAATAPWLFLTRAGNAYNPRALWQELRARVLQRTGKRFYPHLIRTIWATEYLTEHPGDVRGAAYWLNDTPETVLKRYHELGDVEHHQKGQAFNRLLAPQTLTLSPPRRSGSARQTPHEARPSKEG